MFLELLNNISTNISRSEAHRSDVAKFVFILDLQVKKSVMQIEVYGMSKRERSTRTIYIWAGMYLNASENKT